MKEIWFCDLNPISSACPCGLGKGYKHFLSSSFFLCKVGTISLTLEMSEVIELQCLFLTQSSKYTVIVVAVS